MRLYILLSILLHTILFSLFIFNNEKYQEQLRNKKVFIDLNIVEVNITDENTFEENEEKGEVAVNKKIENKKENTCENFYIGIGIVSNLVIKNDEYWLLVNKVYETYPAYKAGIRVGDLILEKEPIRDGGPIGSVIDLVIDRNGEIFVLSVNRGKICVEN